MKINTLPSHLPPVVSLDIETVWATDSDPDPYRDDIITVQVDIPNDDTYILTKNFEWVIPILVDESVVKLIHNASFDTKFLLHNLGAKTKNVFDTFLIERTLTAGRQESSSLEAVALRRLGIHLNKEIQKRFTKGRLTDDMLEYAAQDAAVLHPIYKQQIQELQEEELTDVAELENKLALVIGRVELAGIGFDPLQWERILLEERELRDKAYRGTIEALEVEFYQSDLFGGFSCEVNLNSRDQVLKLLRERGINLPDYRAGTLEFYLRKHPKCAVIRYILDYKEHEKRLSWDYPKHVNPVTGRIHPNISQIGARTGRFAFSHPNLQQVPKLESFRRMFIAEDGYQLITADYSQIELRVLAERASDKVMIKAFKEGVDFHQTTADLIAKTLGTKPDRALGKDCNFAAIYGSSAEGLSASTGISVNKWRRILRAYFDKYSTLKPWYQQSFNNLVKNGYTQTILGRKRWFPELDPTNPGKYRNISRNTPIQGSALDIMKYALVGIDKALEGYGARIVHTIHDEILVESVESQVKEVADLVEGEMISAGGLLLKQVPVEVNLSISKHWGGKDEISRRL